MEEITKVLSVLHIPDGPIIEFVEIIPKDISEKILEVVKEKNKPEIILLKEKEVIQWLLGDTSFLPNIEESKSKSKDEEKKKKLEDEWGRKILKKKRPDLKLDQQWTNMFGQHICEEIFILQGNNPTKPEKKNNFQPDIEISEFIIEVKTCTYFTSGTANEKILGVPFKYCEIPVLYNKPLKIYCLGGAEQASREQYGNLPGIKMSETKKEFLKFFKEKKIEFIGFSDVLKTLINL